MVGNGRFNFQRQVAKQPDPGAMRYASGVWLGGRGAECGAGMTGSGLEAELRPCRIVGSAVPCATGAYSVALEVDGSNQRKADLCSSSKDSGVGNFSRLSVVRSMKEESDWTSDGIGPI